MKKLSSNSQPKIIGDNDIKEVEDTFNIQFPEDYLSFLKKYGGTSTKEVVYSDSCWVNFFLSLKSDTGASIVSLLEGYRINYNEIDWIPFAIDSGGWSFCIALKEDIKGQVWVNKFDSGDENPFAFVANSLEDFINGLQTEEEAFS
jgi:cell wall assembly regulator SMI1